MKSEEEVTALVLRKAELLRTPEGPDVQIAYGDARSREVLFNIWRTMEAHNEMYAQQQTSLLLPQVERLFDDMQLTMAAGTTLDVAWGLDGSEYRKRGIGYGVGSRVQESVVVLKGRLRTRESDLPCVVDMKTAILTVEDQDWYRVNNSFRFMFPELKDEREIWFGDYEGRMSPLTALDEPEGWLYNGNGMSTNITLEERDPYDSERPLWRRQQAGFRNSSTGFDTYAQDWVWGDRLSDWQTRYAEKSLQPAHFKTGHETVLTYMTDTVHRSKKVRDRGFPLVAASLTSVDPESWIAHLTQGPGLQTLIDIMPPVVLPLHTKSK